MLDLLGNFDFNSLSGDIESANSGFNSNPLWGGVGGAISSCDFNSHAGGVEGANSCFIFDPLMHDAEWENYDAFFFAQDALNSNVSPFDTMFDPAFSGSTTNSFGASSPAALAEDPVADLYGIRDGFADFARGDSGFTLAASSAALPFPLLPPPPTTPSPAPTADPTRAHPARHPVRIRLRLLERAFLRISSRAPILLLSRPATLQTTPMAMPQAARTPRRRTYHTPPCLLSLRIARQRQKRPAR
ncbi:hypothetical protein DFH09DRAFT_1370505 [Mycena vulgaris]|nr:hypothetical protein DFH09DRAFT_1370505 [Mycena vulgaris]